jgi:alpha-L-fucosidase
MLNRRQFMQSVLAAPAVFSTQTIAAEGQRMGHSQKILPSYLRSQAALYEKDPHAAALAWFDSTKWGLFMHYGLYSQLGRGEWVMLQQRIPVSDYEKLADSFVPSHFDAGAITDLVLVAKMSYVNLTVKHHEGFCLFHTQQTPYSSGHSPRGRDVVAELAAACRKKGLGLFLYYSFCADWHHPYFCDSSAGWEDYRPAYPQKPAEYKWREDADLTAYIEYAHRQLHELLTQYGPIAGIWFDPVAGYYARPDLFPMEATYRLIRSLQPQCLISFKQGATGEEDFATPERSSKGFAAIDTILPPRRTLAQQYAGKAWSMNQSKRMEICDTLQPKHWGYSKESDGKHRNAQEAAGLAHAAWQQRANLLLNTGLLPDGSVSPEDVRTLSSVAEYL